MQTIALAGCREMGIRFAIHIHQKWISQNMEGENEETAYHDNHRYPAGSSQLV